MRNMKIPYIAGDGIGHEIWNVTRKVVDEAVNKAFSGNRKITWIELLAGKESVLNCGEPLTQIVIDQLRQYKVAIKGPLMTPVGFGFRSLNVEIRQALDLYACIRPMSYTKGVKSPLKKPELINMVVFRENVEDIYGGVEFQAESADSKKMEHFLQEDLHVEKARLPETSAFGIKIISEENSKRLVRSALQHAIDNNLPSLTIVHKGNIMKYTEGAFKEWGYEIIKKEFRDQVYFLDEVCSIEEIDGKDKAEKFVENCKKENKILVRDCIADAFFQDILLHPEKHAVIATTNLNGDYISDSIAGCIGGIGISPGANINFETGCAIFEATHGSAPDIQGKDIANPLSLIYSAAMMLDYIEWNEAADLIRSLARKMIAENMTTKDLSQDPNQALSCSEFGNEFVRLIQKEK